MSQPIRTFAELQQEVHAALLRQNPHWIEPDGQSSLCEYYDARFAQILSLFEPRLCQPVS